MLGALQFWLTMMLSSDNDTKKYRRSHFLKIAEGSWKNPWTQPGGRCSNSFAILGNPRLRAHSKQRLPALGSAPASSSICTHSACPVYDAMKSAEAPLGALALTSAPDKTKALTHST